MDKQDEELNLSEEPKENDEVIAPVFEHRRAVHKATLHSDPQHLDSHKETAHVVEDEDEDEYDQEHDELVQEDDDRWDQVVSGQE